MIEGDTRPIASKPELFDLLGGEKEIGDSRCLVTGEIGKTARTTTATMIPGSKATAKIVSFQKGAGYDSYGKSQGENAPISKEAEFAYSTALKKMLKKGSRNKFSIGNRTFVFWASSNNEAAQAAEESLFALMGWDDRDNPNRGLDYVREVFRSIYNGKTPPNGDDRFYILGLAPNAARIAVVYWAECPLKEFAGLVLRHFSDMEMMCVPDDGQSYVGLRSMLDAVTRGGKGSEAAPNLPEAVARSIFQGLPYPASLFGACLRRIRAERPIRVEQYVHRVRAAIIKAYLNRLNDNENKKIETMLDKENTNQGYLCGRLFAVLDKMQEDANRNHTVRERYMNSASSTPTSVFATLLNLSTHHAEKLSAGQQVYYEKLKQEIMSKLPVEGFPAHLDLQDQGRFFVGYYHQRQDLFTKKEDKGQE